MKFLLLSLLAISTMATEWETIEVPNTYCGNGDQYKTFIQKGDPNKLEVHFAGGGACWSKSTCFGPNFRAKISASDNPNYGRGGMVKNNPLEEFTKIVFNYCTGDVFVGNHTAEYGIKHVGKRNIFKILNYLKENNIIDFDSVEHFVQTGSSAGALGSLFLAKKVQTYFPNAQKKTMLLETPGLHWGERFWDKFTLQILEDFYEASKDIVDNLFEYGGMTIKHLPQICDTYYDWSVGITQADKDIAMSALFGSTNPYKHKELVHGRDGLLRASRKISNCAAWVPNSFLHAFSKFDFFQIVKAGNKTAISFFEDVLAGKTDKSYTDPE